MSEDISLYTMIVNFAHGNCDDEYKQRMIDKLKIFIEFDNEKDKYNEKIDIDKLLRVISTYVRNTAGGEDEDYLMSIIVKLCVYESLYTHVDIFNMFIEDIYKIAIMYQNDLCLNYLIDTFAFDDNIYNQIIKNHKYTHFKKMYQIDINNEMSENQIVKLNNSLIDLSIIHDDFMIFKYLVDFKKHSQNIIKLTIGLKDTQYFEYLLACDLVDKDESIYIRIAFGGNVDYLLAAIYYEIPMCEDFLLYCIVCENLECLKYMIDSGTAYDSSFLLNSCVDDATRNYLLSKMNTN